MLHARNSTSSAPIVAIYDCMKTIVGMTNPSNYNPSWPSILVICILKVNHQIYWPSIFSTIRYVVMRDPTLLKSHMHHPEISWNHCYFIEITQINSEIINHYRNHEITKSPLKSCNNTWKMMKSSPKTLNSWITIRDRTLSITWI